MFSQLFLWPLNYIAYNLWYKGVDKSKPKRECCGYNGTNVDFGGQVSRKYSGSSKVLDFDNNKYTLSPISQLGFIGAENLFG